MDKKNNSSSTTIFVLNDLLKGKVGSRSNRDIARECRIHSVMYNVDHAL